MGLFTNDFDKNSFCAFAVEFPVKNLFPGTKVKFVDNRPTKIIVLPDRALYDSQLEAAAGGDDGGPDAGPDDAA